MASTNPPWRSLDAPASTSASSSTAPATTPAVPTPPTTWATSGRIMATLAAAVAFAILAFVFATGGAGTAEIIVDGGAALAVASSGTSDSATFVGSGGAALQPINEPDMLVIEVVGAVRHPGVYRLVQGARVGDLIVAAGGYGARVDTVRAERELNQAALLHDGEQVRVPARDDADAGIASSEQAGTGRAADPATDSLIDLNTATEAQLDALPGIGPVTIEKILASRDEARFSAVEDLRTRELVGQKTYDKIVESIVVR